MSAPAAQRRLVVERAGGRVLPVNPASGAQAQAAHGVARAARAAGLRVEVNDADEPLGRGSVGPGLRRAAYRVVVGDREAAAGDVAVSLREGGNLPPMPAAAFVDQVSQVVRERSARLWPA